VAKGGTMLGLVNAVGAPETARTETADRMARQRARVEAENAPILNTGEAAVYRVLRTAIQALDESLSDAAARRAPSGDESDRFDQAEMERSTGTPGLGGNLDVLA